MDLNKKEDLSDDEIFIGKLTLKELKKHILWDKQHEPWSISATNSPMHVADPNTSLKIIQTQSQPNLICNRDIYASDPSEAGSPCWIDKASDDSFIKIENMVEKICLSPERFAKTEDLNNTLEVIEYILNNPPTDSGDARHNTTTIKQEIKNEPLVSPMKAAPKIADNKVVTPHCSGKITDKKVITPKPPSESGHGHTNLAIQSKSTPRLATPLKHRDCITTPLRTKSKPTFKTPAQPLSFKKPLASSLKKTPSKTNAYQHISSPVASYIKNCPTVPLVQDVHPKKPLPGPSSIPKFVKPKQSDKENVVLPSVAYKSAKKTKLIDIPDETKLPQSHWAKKITASLPKPMVIKHNHRETNLIRKVFTQEESFANLSYHQAEVSVCTQKSAFKPKN